MVCAVDQLTPMRTNCMPMSQQSGSDNPGRYVGKLCIADCCKTATSSQLWLKVVVTETSHVTNATTQLLANFSSTMLTMRP